MYIGDGPRRFPGNGSRGAGLVVLATPHATEGALVTMSSVVAADNTADEVTCPMVFVKAAAQPMVELTGAVYPGTTRALLPVWSLSGLEE